MVNQTGNQGLPYPEPDDEPADMPVFVQALAEAIEGKLVQVFTSEAQRSTKVPVPTSGMVSVITSTDVVEFYDGAAWKRLYPPAVPTFTRGTVVPSNASGVNGDVFFKF